MDDLQRSQVKGEKNVIERRNKCVELKSVFG